MKKAFYFLSIIVSCKVNAQFAIKPMIEAPFSYDITHGSSYIYKRSGGLLIPGIEFERTFKRDKMESLRLNYSVGLFYLNSRANTTFLPGMEYADDDEFYSEINYSLLNIPLAIRGELRQSELLENTFVGMEFGLLNNIWMDYQLKEIVSIKSYDQSGNITGETIYRDAGNLLSAPGRKITVSIFWGIHGSVRRFYYGIRMNLITLIDFYSDNLKESWQVPLQYALYEQSHETKGKMKQPYISILLGLKINGSVN